MNFSSLQKKHETFNIQKLSIAFKLTDYKHIDPTLANQGLLESNVNLLVTKYYITLHLILMYFTYCVTLLRNALKYNVSILDVSDWEKIYIVV